MEDPKYTKALYDQLSSKLELGTQADFEKQIGTDEKFRKAIFDQAGSELDLGDYKTYEGYVKKKESPADYGLPSKEVFSEMFGNISKEVSQRPKLNKTTLSPSDEVNFEKWTAGEPENDLYDFRGFYEAEKQSGTLKPSMGDYLKSDPDFHFGSIGLNGKVLKSPDHPTFEKTLQGEEQMGNELYVDEESTLRTRPKTHQFDTPNLSLKSPEFKGPELETLSGTVAAYVSGKRITDREYKAEAEKRISEIDTKLKELPKAQMQTGDVGAGTDFKFASTPEEDEKLKLQQERTKLTEAITTPTKAQYLFGKAYSQSLIGLANKIMTGSELTSPEWLAKYDAGTLTDATATALGFMIDMPFFGGMGKVGAEIGKVAAKPIVDRVMAKGVEKLMKAGIEETLAKKLTLNAATKVSQSIAGMTSSGVALGSYTSVSDALNQWAVPDANFDDIKWGQSLKKGVKNFALGVGVGGLGLGSAAIASKASAIPNAAARIGTKVGVATGGLTAESALFTYGGALLDGRAPNEVTGKEFLETVALLGLLKVSNVAGNIPEAVTKPKETLTNLYRSLQYDPKKPGQGQFEVDIEPWEVDAMGGKDYKSVMDIASKDDKVLADILNSDKVPALLKQKLLWGARGVAIQDVNINAEKVVPNEEFVDIYNKEGVLVDKRKYASKQEADQASLEMGLQLEDNKMQRRSAEPDVDRVKIISDLKSKGTDVDKLLMAVDKPVKERTPEESKMVGDYYSMIPKEKAKEKGTDKVSIGERDIVTQSEKNILKIKSESSFNIPILKGKEQVGKATIEDTPDGWRIKWIEAARPDKDTRGAGRDAMILLNKEALKEGKVLMSDVEGKNSSDMQKAWEKLVEAGEAVQLPDKTWSFNKPEKPIEPAPDKPKAKTEEPIVEPKKLTKKQQAEVDRAQAALEKSSKPKRTVKISPNSESGKIVNATPSDFTDSMAQFLLSGGTLSRADFLRHSNYGNKDIVGGGLSFYLNKEKGVAFDVLHERLAEEYGRKNGGEITPDDILKAIDALKVDGKLNKGTIIQKFKERHKEIDWQDKEVLSPEERAKRDMDDDLEIVKSTGEFTDLVKAAEGDKDVEDAIKAFQTELGSGEFDWDYIKDKIKTDPEFFVNNWLFDLKPEQIKKLNEILSNNGEKIEFSERVAQPPVIEGKGKGDIVSGRIETPAGENGPKETGKPEEVKPIIDEKPIDTANPPISKGEENIVSGGTEAGKEPVVTEGEAKPITKPEEIKFARRTDGILKNKSEYTPEEWTQYTKSVIDKKGSELPITPIEKIVVNTLNSFNDKVKQGENPTDLLDKLKTNLSIEEKGADWEKGGIGENQLRKQNIADLKEAISRIEAQIKPITATGEKVSTTLNDAVSKYGWSAVKNPEGFWLQNKDGKPVVKVVMNTKKGTYKFLDMSGTKLMDGRGQLEKSAEKLLKDMYYAKEVKPNIEELKNTTQGKLIAGVGGKIAELQSRGAKVDHYQRLLESYEKSPNQKTKDKILQIEKELGYEELGNSYFNTKPEIVQDISKDLLGNPKEESMLTFNERLKERFGEKQVTEATKENLRVQYQRELDRGYLKKFVEEGRITQADADAVLESAGLKAPKIETSPTQGIKFKDKTYTEVDQVLDALDKGDITFEESKQLREDVGKFEDDLRKQATNNSTNMDKKMGNHTKDAEDEMLKTFGKKKGGNGKVAIRFLPPDPIPLMNTVLYKQLVKVRDALNNRIANVLQAGMKSQMDLLRWPSKAITNFWGGLGRTQADIHGKGGKPGKLAFTGTVKSFAPYEAKELRGKWLDIVHSDPESLRRVLDVLDPDPEFAIEKLSYGDLSLAEKNLYFKMRDWNTWVHETNYANGFLDTETYLKNKDVTGDSKYIARMYDKYEGETLLDPAIQEFINRGNSAITTKMMTDMFKAREESTEWKKEHAIRDPTYLTAKRVMQTIQNVAIKGYMDLVIQEHPDFVLSLKKGEAVPKGYTKLGSSYSWGPFRNKAVINHVVEDFTGFYYSNAVANDLYNAFKKVDRSNVNQFYKKLRTVYNPMVQLGNVTGNIFFASANGINPVSFLGKFPEAIKLYHKSPEVYKALLKTGLIGDVAFTGEMKPLAIIKSKEGGKLSKADELATKAYVGADNIAKISAYLVFREQGMSHDASVRRAYDAFQNYSTVGKTWDFTSKIPLIGPTFAKFQADLQRILVNNITTTPLTLIGTLMLIKMGGILASTLSGETEEERKVREGRKGVAKIPLVNIPLSFKVGKSEVNVARYLSPLYNYNYADAGTQLSEVSKFLPIQLSKVNRPILGETSNLPAFADATWGWIGSVAFDRDYRGISIQNPNASAYHNANITTDERILNVMTYIARSQVPFFKGAQDMYDGIRGNLDYYGRKRDWKQTILNNVIKIQEFDKPELKVYVERNIDYLTNRYTALAQRMGDANSDFLKTIKNAEEKGLSAEALARAYTVADKKRSGQLQKSMDEQVPVMQELERLTKVYAGWYPKDESIGTNFQHLESGKNQRFNVLNDVDLQKKYPAEYSILKKNDLLNKPVIPSYWQGVQLSEEDRKTYSNVYWSEYLRNLNSMGLTTQEEMDEAKKSITNIIESTTRPVPEKTTTLQEMAADAASSARDIANESIRSKK